MTEMLELDQIVPTIEKVKFTIIQMEQKLSKMAKEIEQKEKQILERERELEEQSEKGQQLEGQLVGKEQQLVEREKELEKQLKKSEKLKNEYLAVEKELTRISSLYSEVEGKQEDVTNVKEVLSIYITLLEKVFEGKPHAKILFLLHGAKTTMTREELTKSSAFNPAVVLRSIHELRNAELVDFDNEKDIITLKRRIYD
ncbi:MAG: hypothetical protein ACXADA_13365 [Candidatus Hodarchaeales archaeon]